MKLHLATNNEWGFNYLSYLSVMSAILNNDVVLWHEDKPDTNWWELIEKTSKRSDSLELKKLDPVTGLTLDAQDQTGRLDIIYLSEFVREKSIDDALIDHDIFRQGKSGEFEEKDITLVRVFTPSDKDNLDFITPQWVSANDTLLSELIKTVFLESVWNPYDRERKKEV